MGQFRSKKNYWLFFWILFYFLLGVLLLRNSFAALDPDLGWHLEVGSSIIANHALPDQNIYNFSYTGSWVDHEWLSNALMAMLLSGFGYLGLHIFFAIIALSGLLMLHYCARRYFGAGQIYIAVGLIFGLLASMPHFGLRVQEFGFFFLTLELWLFLEFERSREMRLIWLLTPLIYLWACLHGSFLLGLGLFAAWVSSLLVRRYIMRSKLASYHVRFISPSRKEMVILSLIAGLSFLFSWLTPYGARLYGFLGGYADTAYLRYISEWQGQLSVPFVYPQLVFLALVACLAALFAIDIYRSRSRLDIWQAGLGALFFVLAFRSRRHFPLFFAVSFLALAVPAKHLFASALETGISYAKYLRIGVVIILGFLVTAISTDLSLQADPFLTNCDRFPCQAVDYLKSQPKLAEKRLFNEYDWGGYLIKVWPGKQIFIDGRLPQVPMAGHTYIEEFVSFYKEGSDRTGLLSSYGIGMVMLRTEDKHPHFRAWERYIFGLKDEDFIPRNRLREYLEADAGWRTIYRDDVATIYEKI